MDTKTVKTLPNNEVIEAVISMLETTPRVVLPVRGYSMLPFIIGGVESVELVKPVTVAVGDVVLAWINGCRYVIHRVIRIDGDRIQLMGDGNLSADEFCQRTDVVARAIYVVGRDGGRRFLYAPWRVRASRLWWRLRPLRRWILAVYRRTLLRFEV